MRNLLILFLIPFLISCSAPKPSSEPSWHSSPPQSHEHYIASASSQDEQQAKKLASISLREKIQKDFTETLSKKSMLLEYDAQFIEQVAKEGETIINNLAMRSVSILQIQKFQEKFYILLSTPKKNIFEQAAALTVKTAPTIQQEFQNAQSATLLQKYLLLHRLSSHMPKMCAIEILKESSINTHNTADTLSSCYKISKTYNEYAKETTLFIASDVASRTLIDGIKHALKKEKITIAKTPDSPNTLRLFVTSKLHNLEEYEFHLTKQIVTYRLLSSLKEILSERQHTFSAKSKVSHEDAKEQIPAQQNGVIARFGIYDFIGLQSDK